MSTNQQPHHRLIIISINPSLTPTPNTNRRASKALGGVRAAQLPDNVQLLRALAEAQPAPLLVTTPPQDYVRIYVFWVGLWRW